MHAVQQDMQCLMAALGWQSTRDQASTCGPPKPRNAVFEAWLVRHTCPTARTLGILYLRQGPHYSLTHGDMRSQPCAQVCMRFVALCTGLHANAGKAHGLSGWSHCNTQPYAQRPVMCAETGTGSFVCCSSQRTPSYRANRHSDRRAAASRQKQVVCTEGRRGTRGGAHAVAVHERAVHDGGGQVEAVAGVAV